MTLWFDRDSTKNIFSTLFCLENQNTQLEDATRKTKSVEFLWNHKVSCWVKYLTILRGMKSCTYSPKLNTYLWFQNTVRWARQKRRAQNLHFQFHEFFCLVHFLYNDVHQRRKFCKISSGCQAAWTLHIWLLHKLLCSTRTKVV